MTNIKPIGSMILVEKIEQSEKTTSSGLVLSVATLDNELARGKVVGVGNGYTDMNGNQHNIPLQENDVVIFNEINATEVSDNSNNKFYFLAFKDVYGVEEQDANN